MSIMRTNRGDKNETRGGNYYPFYHVRRENSLRRARSRSREGSGQSRTRIAIQSWPISACLPSRERVDRRSWRGLRFARGKKKARPASSAAERYATERYSSGWHSRGRYRSGARPIAETRRRVWNHDCALRSSHALSPLVDGRACRSKVKRFIDIATIGRDLIDRRTRRNRSSRCRDPSR